MSFDKVVTPRLWRLDNIMHQWLSQFWISFESLIDERLRSSTRCLNHITETRRVESQDPVTDAEHQLIFAPFTFHQCVLLCTKIRKFWHQKLSHAPSSNFLRSVHFATTITIIQRNEIIYLRNVGSTINFFLENWGWKSQKS